MMKKMNLKKFAAAALGMTLAVSNVTGALACTGIYVGSEVSESGSTFIGRSEDIGDLYGKVYTVKPAQDWPKGAVYKDAYGFSTAYPAHTYAYSVVRDSYAYGEAVKDENGNPCGEPYGAAGMNEKNVAISATVSTRYNERAKAADPLVKGGICEISIPTMVLGGAATAKEGVELLADIIDKHGAGECNAITISDPDEVWYFEVVSGHQYAAVKLPKDKVGVNPNITLLGEIDPADTENVVVSEGLVKTAEEGGFLKLGENGNIHVAKSYAAAHSGKGQYSRYYQGVYYVNPEEAAKLDLDNINNNENPLDLMVQPTEKLSTLKTLQYLAYRGQGSAMDSNQNPDIYPIGNTRQAECHVFELRSDMPDELATIQWEAMADAEFSIFVPFYGSLITETSPLYQVEGKQFAENSINWNFQMLNHLCSQNREKYGVNVKAYFEDYQESLIAQQEQVDKDMVKVLAKGKKQAQEAATQMGKELAEQVFAVSKSVLTELQAYIAAGNFEEAFVPTAMTQNIMPAYKVPQQKPLPFTDVHVYDWFYAAVKYTTEHGIFSGVSETRFAPHMKMTRGMMVQTLYAMAGKPEVKNEVSFNDVSANDWYADAVAWAVENDIAVGYGNGNFGANDNVTRAQMAVMVWGYVGKAAAEGDGLAGFVDAEKVAQWAKDGINWAVENGLMAGVGGGLLAPNATATRAEAAVMLGNLHATT